MDSGDKIDKTEVEDTAQSEEFKDNEIYEVLIDLIKTTDENLKAVEIDAVGVLKFFIKQLPILNIKLNAIGQTLLHIACIYRKVTIVKMLIDMKADVNAVDKNGSTPLHQIAMSDFPESVEIASLLMNAGAELLSKPNKLNPLQVAITWHCNNVIKVIAIYVVGELEGLCESYMMCWMNDHDNSDIYKLEEQIMKFFKEYGNNKFCSFDINKKMRDGKRLLNKACYIGSYTFIKFLIDHNADINAKTDVGGDTPLHNIICQGCKISVPEKMKIFKYMLDNGADYNLMDDALNSVKNTLANRIKSRNFQDFNYHMYTEFYKLIEKKEAEKAKKKSPFKSYNEDETLCYKITLPGGGSVTITHDIGSQFNKDIRINL